MTSCSKTKVQTYNFASAQNLYAGQIFKKVNKIYFNDRIKESVVLELRELAKSYGKIIVIMGKKYQEIIKSELNSKFYIIFDRSGIYGYNKLLKDCRLKKISGNLIIKISSSS